MNLTAKDILIQARTLLTDESKWIKGNDAMDQHGSPVHVNSQDATCFCMYGALIHSDVDFDCDEFDKASNALRKVIKNPWVSAFNDAADTTHPMVLAAFDKAIDSL